MRGRRLAGGAGAELSWCGRGAFEAHAGGGAEDQWRRVEQRGMWARGGGAKARAAAEQCQVRGGGSRGRRRGRSN